jgi:anti-anti-sigma factor
MSEMFSIAVEPYAGAAVVRVRGRLDARTSPRLVTDCEEVRAACGGLVLNLAEVSFLSSSGVGAILALADRARQDDAAFRIAAPSVPVRAAIGLLNLDRFLAIDADERDSLAAMGGSHGAAA